MRIGICTDIKNLKTAEELGFDYVEAKLSAAVALSEEDFNAILSANEGAKIRIEKACILLPKTMRIIGSEYDEKALDEYLDKAFTRMNQLGATVVSFGSGKCRNVPEGMSQSEGFEELVKVTRHIGEVASRYGILIAVEPLNAGETNLVKTVAEGDELVQRVNHPSVKLLADAYHMRKEDEPMEDIVKLKSELVHAHIATKDGRGFPKKDAETDEFFDALKSAGYKGDLSIEASGNWDWIECSPEAIKCLKSY